MERTLQQPASTRIRQSLPLQVFEDIQQILVSSLQVLPGEPLQIARNVGVGKIAGAAQILDENVALILGQQCNLLVDGGGSRPAGIQAMQKLLGVGKNGRAA